MKKVVFTEHALYQLTERRISQGLVKEALLNPDALVTQADGRKRAARFFREGGKKYALVVVHEESSRGNLVITVFITSKIKKYFG